MYQNQFCIIHCDTMTIGVNFLIPYLHVPLWVYYSTVTIQMLSFWRSLALFYFSCIMASDSFTHSKTIHNALQVVGINKQQLVLLAHFRILLLMGCQPLGYSQAKDRDTPSFAAAIPCLSNCVIILFFSDNVRRDSHSNSAKNSAYHHGCNYWAKFLGSELMTWH